MNYWKQFAAMLGLELGQEFRIICSNGKTIDNALYEITEDGLFSKANDLSGKVTSILDLLLSGDYKAVPKPWKPKFGDAYWKWATNLELAQFKRWNDASTDFACWKLGNCFKTSEEAKSKGKEIMEKLVKEYEEA